MNEPKPIIKFNGGNPIALCNRCFIIMCDVSCTSLEDHQTCIVTSRNGNNDGDYIDTPIGGIPPLYCKHCANLLKYSLNE